MKATPELLGNLKTELTLEVEARAKLHDARIKRSGETAEAGAVYVEDIAVLAAGDGIAAAGQEEVCAIQNVEHLHAELQVSGFTHLEVAEKTRVPVEIYWAVEGVDRKCPC